MANGVAPVNRELVADEFAAASVEDWAGDTCPPILAAFGGASSDESFAGGMWITVS